jgi:hypothetical protein
MTVPIFIRWRLFTIWRALISVTVCLVVGHRWTSLPYQTHRRGFRAEQGLIGICTRCGQAALKRG